MKQNSQHYCLTLIALFFFLGCINTSGQNTIRILPLGNSVTRGSMCLNGDISTCLRLEDSQAIGYRQRLSNLLSIAGYTIDLVGSQQYGSALMSDPDNAGFSGIRSENLADIMQTGTSTHTGQVAPGAYLNYYPADIILLHIGTNDVLDGNYSSNGIGRILDAVKNYETASGKPVLVFLARIISCNGYPCNTHTGTVTFNNNLVTLAQNRINNDDHIVLVDMECGAGMDYYTDLIDQVHPGQTGYNKMADKWFEAVHQYNSAPVVAQIPDQAVERHESFNSVSLDLYVTDIEDTPDKITWSISPATPAHLNVSIDNNRVAHITVKDPLWYGAETIEFIATDGGRVLAQLQKSNSTPVIFTVNMPDAPAAPDNLSGAATSTSSIELSWRDNANNEEGFEIYRSETSGSGFVMLYTASPNTISYQDNSCTEHTQYYYRVSAFNAGGNSSYSNEISVTTLLGIPVAPAGLMTETDSGGTVQLGWTDNSGNEDGFEIERYDEAENKFKLIHTTAMDVTGYADTGLTENMTYAYRVRAYNATGASAYSDTAEITVPRLMLEPPTNLRDIQTTHQSVILVWDSLPSDGYYFEVQYAKTAEGSFIAIQNIGPDVNSYMITGLDADTYYFFRIRVIQDTLISLFSDTISVKTLADPDLPDDVADRDSESTTGINLLVYPNPLKDKAMLSFNMGAGKNSLIILYDMQGRLLITDHIYTTPGREKVQRELNVAALDAGIYMLVVTTKEETVIRKIVISEQ